MTTLPSRMLADLAEQHTAIRGLIERCEATEGPAQVEAVDDLRLALDAHNRYEERLLLPILPGLDAFGDVRIEQMIDDHIREHLAMNEQLDADTPAGIRAALALVMAHLDSEERYVVTSRVLRDDVVTLEAAS